jgi:hypothetical protein
MARIPANRRPHYQLGRERRGASCGRKDFMSFSFCKLVRDRMKKPSPPARRPGAGAWPGPVRNLPGGETFPAALENSSH